MRLALIATLFCASLSNAQVKKLDLFFGTMKVGDIAPLPKPVEPPFAGPSFGTIYYKIETVKDDFFVVSAEHWQTAVNKVSFVVKGQTKDLADGQRFIPKDLWKAAGTQKVGSRTLFVLEQVAEKPEEKALRIRKEQFIELVIYREAVEKRLGPKAKSKDQKKWEESYAKEWAKICIGLNLTEPQAKQIIAEGEKEKWPTK